jgi:hypothetical protein
VVCAVRLPVGISLAVAAVLGLAGCGSGDGERTARALTPVALTVTAPADMSTTRRTSVTVRGTVDPPGAAVTVLGARAEVVGGSFSASVDLAPGANVIDVAATAPGRGPALTALRVTREMPVAVPDLSGLAPEAARAQVEALGLALDVRAAGGLLEELLPGDPGICEQDPSPGDEVMRGTTVRVLVAKRC